MRKVLPPRAKCDVAKQRRAHYRSRSKSQRTYAIIYYLRLSTISSFWQHKKRVVHCTVSQLWLTSRLHSFQTTLDISEQQQKSCRTSCLCVSLLKWVKRTSHWRVFFFFAFSSFSCVNLCGEIPSLQSTHFVSVIREKQRARSIFLQSGKNSFVLGNCATPCRVFAYCRWWGRSIIHKVIINFFFSFFRRVHFLPCLAAGCFSPSARH